MSDSQFQLVSYMLWLIMLNTSEKGGVIYWISLFVLCCIIVAQIIMWWLKRKFR